MLKPPVFTLGPCWVNPMFPQVRRLRLDLERERCEAELHREEARKLEELGLILGYSLG